MNLTLRILCAASSVTAAGLAPAQNLQEGFEDAAGLPGAGWAFINVSSPLGTSGWYQGDPTAFAPHAGSGFIASDFTCGSGVATLNNWLLLPTRMLYNGDHFGFFTRTLQVPATYPDRLQVRLSTAGASTNVGTSAGEVGDFTRLLIDVNPNYFSTGYPGVWQGRSATLAGLPPEGVLGRLAFRYFVEDGGPGGNRGTMIGIDSAEYRAFGAPGACCLPDGSCMVASQIDCTAAHGVHHGAGSTCATAGCSLFGFIETNDAGDLPSSAVVIRGPASVPLTRIFGQCAFFNADVFRISICDRASFSVSRDGFTGVLHIFELSGRGLVKGGTGQGPAITGQFIPSNGEYYLALAVGSSQPQDAFQQSLWNTTGPSGSQSIEWTPNGPGAANPIGRWFSYGSTTDYGITLTGACFVSPSCFPNCDQSTSPPILTPNDFACFLNNFALGNPGANCDGSTSAPILTANDFQCFLIQFANGCP